MQIDPVLRFHYQRQPVAGWFHPRSSYGTYTRVKHIKYNGKTTKIVVKRDPPPDPPTNGVIRAVRTTVDIYVTVVFQTPKDALHFKLAHTDDQLQRMFAV